MIANDLPLGLVVPDGPLQEGLAQGDDGAPLGREGDIAQVLTALSRAGIRNHVWLTADVHYTAAHHYSPDRAAYQDFDPFWEFVSGPLNAGAFGPNKAGRHVRPGRGLRRRSPGAQRLPGGGLPVLRRGRGGRYEPTAHGHAARRRGRGALHPDAGPGAALRRLGGRLGRAGQRAASIPSATALPAAWSAPATPTR
ncbi:alkaline phosphatase D family protein [Nocardioides convexus]|uniref:alkaline phosphatase D family protein n=1 Tax=Nocardioides convexus TaxID=2712224 RepID=UPI0024184CD4|nr:alkaline phosphatase D family protein [Nocardioides convexus]